MSFYAKPDSCSFKRGYFDNVRSSTTNSKEGYFDDVHSSVISVDKITSHNNNEITIERSNLKEVNFSGEATLHIHGKVKFTSENHKFIINDIDVCDSCLNEGGFGFMWSNFNYHSGEKNNEKNDENNNENNNENNENNKFKKNTKLCMNCIFDSAVHFQASQNWINNHGDPLSTFKMEVKKEIDSLKNQINILKSTKN